MEEVGGGAGDVGETSENRSIRGPTRCRFPASSDSGLLATGRPPAAQPEESQ
jgi:hypothetical protein